MRQVVALGLPAGHAVAEHLDAVVAGDAGIAERGVAAVERRVGLAGAALVEEDQVAIVDAHAAGLAQAEGHAVDNAAAGAAMQEDDRVWFLVGGGGADDDDGQFDGLAVVGAARFRDDHGAAFDGLLEAEIERAAVVLVIAEGEGGGRLLRLRATEDGERRHDNKTQTTPHDRYSITRGAALVSLLTRVVKKGEVKKASRPATTSLCFTSLFFIPP